VAWLVGFWDGRPGRYRLPLVRPGVSRAEARSAAERGSKFHAGEHGNLSARFDGHVSFSGARRYASGEVDLVRWRTAATAAGRIGARPGDAGHWDDAGRKERQNRWGTIWRPDHSRVQGKGISG